jgi:GAF domain-containing protein
MIKSKKVVHLLDAAANETYATRRDPTVVAAVELGGIRTALIVPMLKEDELVGAFIVSRQEVRPFSDKQIALVTNFAAQAVIAIENARLLNELRQRTAGLTESLEQQTATSEVLQVISSSSGNLQPVFDAMLANATKICSAKFGVLWLTAGKGFRCVALHNAPSAFAAQYKGEPVIHPAQGTGLRRLFETRKVAQVADMTTILPYIERDPFVVRSVELGGYRSVVNVPMMKENELVGAISIYHLEVRPFTERQIELVCNFANQAVIAIENTRLLNELRQRTADLTKSLEQQTATSEVLQVISSSPGNVQPVFSTVLENAVRICEAKFGLLYLYEGGGFRSVAAREVPPAFAEALGKLQFPPAPGGVLDAVMKTGRTVHVSDLAATQGYLERHHRMVAGVELGGIRTVVGVPMLRGDELVGVIGIYRQEVRPFTEKQIALLTNFAAQAVIAIDNTRTAE